MRNYMGVAGAVIVTIAVGCPAQADVAVVPDSWSPTLHLRVVERVAPEFPAHRVNLNELTAQPSAERLERCLEDESGVTRCYADQFDPPDDPAVPDERELTEGDILQAVREIGLPSLAVRIEPGKSTLVNARTNFFTNPVAFARSVTLIGFDVDLAANPVRYQWIHGDGTRTSTTKPGRPYPHLDVTYRYRAPAAAVSPRVDVTYRVRYRVEGGAWITLGQTLTAPGPAGNLAVSEAVPVLTAP